MRMIQVAPDFQDRPAFAVTTYSSSIPVLMASVGLAVGKYMVCKK